MTDKIRVAQISDLHLFQDPTSLLQAAVPEDNLDAILDNIKSENNYDFLLLTGDLTDQGAPEAYQRLVQKIEQLKKPCYFVPGNHDDNEKIRLYLKDDYICSDCHILKENWQFILLNSSKPGCTEGYLSEGQLSFLRSCLHQNRDLYTCIAMHHHPVPSDSFMDEVMLTNANEFFKIINEHQKVRCVLYGHLHQVIEELRGSCLFLSGPSTAYQIKPHTKKFMEDDLPPGYRWLEFEYNGNIKTGISRLPMSSYNGRN